MKRLLFALLVLGSSLPALATWSGDGGVAYTVGAENGVVNSTQGNGSAY